MRPIVLLMAAMAVALVLASGVAMAASQLDQQNDPGTHCCAGEINHDIYWAQTFTAGVTGRVDKVAIYGGRIGTPPWRPARLDQGPQQLRRAERYRPGFREDVGGGLPRHQRLLQRS